MINVVIVEDNTIIREGISALINGTPEYKCVGAFEDCESFLSVLDRLDVNVVLMDIGLGGMSGIDGIKAAMKKKPSINILMLTIYEDEKLIFEAICAGACGYLIKKTPPVKLLEAIKEANEGGSPMSSNIARKVIKVFQQKAPKKTEKFDYKLSDRELEVLTKLAQGLNYSEIAESLFISIDTVRHHIRNTYQKLHVHSQSEAVAKAIRKGLI